MKKRTSTAKKNPARLNRLEGMMKKAVSDPSLHGEMFRLLLESKLYFLVPPVGEPVENDQDAPLKWCRFEDQRGAFTPVFTSIAAADERRSDVPELQVLTLEKIDAEILLETLSRSETPVRVIARGPVQVTLKQPALHLLLAGAFTS